MVYLVHPLPFTKLCFYKVCLTQLMSKFFRHTILADFDSFFLPDGIRCSRLILYFSYLRSGNSHFFKDPWVLWLKKWHIETVGARDIHCYWVDHCSEAFSVRTDFLWKACGQCLDSLFCMWISSCFNTICWKDYLFSIVTPLLFCQTSADYIYGGLFLSALFMFH